MKNIKSPDRVSKKWTKADKLIVCGFVLVIGVASIPIFTSIANKDITSTVKDVVRTSAMNNEQSFLSNNRTYAPYIVNYIKSKDDVELSLDLEKSNAQKFCVVGVSKKDPTVRYSYDSSMDGLLPSGQECVKISSGKTWANGLRKTKVLIVHAADEDHANKWKDKLSSVGFGIVDYKDDPSISEYYNYDLIVASSENFDIPENVSENLRIAYTKGVPVFTEGKTNSEYNLPTIIEGTQFVNQKKSLEFKKSGLPVEPLFSYAFKSPEMKNPGDFTCIDKPVGKSVSITHSKHPVDSRIDCSTSLVLSENGGDNRWVHISNADMLSTNELVDVSALWAAKIKQ